MKLKNWLKLFFYCLMLAGIGTLALVISLGFHDQIQKSDVAIIFGSKVKHNGLPSSRLRARLNKGIELYQQGFFSHIIVSGGTGKEGYDEAQVMKKYLIAHHIPSSAIFVDSHGNNTQLTAMNSRKIMHENGFKSAMVITQYFHILRARIALEKSGISPVYSAHANILEWRDFYSILREIAGIYDYLLFRDFKNSFHSYPKAKS